MLYAQPGDLIFTRGSAILSKMIRWMEREPGEDPSWPNHVLTCVKGGWIVPPAISFVDGPTPLAETVEALWKVEHTEWYMRHGHEKVSVEVWRTSQNEEQVRREKDWLIRQVGNRYGWWKLLLIAAQRLTRIPFKKIMFVKKRPICSVLSALGKSVGEVRFGDMDPFDCTPDNMHDYVMASLDWQFVGIAFVNGGAK